MEFIAYPLDGDSLTITLSTLVEDGRKTFDMIVFPRTLRIHMRDQGAHLLISADLT